MEGYKKSARADACACFYLLLRLLLFDKVEDAQFFGSFAIVDAEMSRFDVERIKDALRIRSVADAKRCLEFGDEKTSICPALADASDQAKLTHNSFWFGLWF